MVSYKSLVTWKEISESERNWLGKQLTEYIKWTHDVPSLSFTAFLCRAMCNAYWTPLTSGKPHYSFIYEMYEKEKRKTSKQTNEMKRRIWTCNLNPKMEAIMIQAHFCAQASKVVFSFCCRPLPINFFPFVTRCKHKHNIRYYTCYFFAAQNILFYKKGSIFRFFFHFHIKAW